MEMRFLGRSGLHVSVLGFGVMTFGDSGSQSKWPFEAISSTGLADATRQMSIFIDARVNVFDTADIYAAGQSEEILGQALGTRRGDVVVATKAFVRMGKRTHDTGLSRRHLSEGCEESLRWLGSEWIDLYQVHSFDALVPLEETLAALGSLVTSGKVRCLGRSSCAGWRLMKALGLHDRLGLGLERIVGRRIQYSMMWRDAGEGLLPCGVDQGVGTLIWSPLTPGFLSGQVPRRAHRRSLPGEDWPNRRLRRSACRKSTRCRAGRRRGTPRVRIAEVSLNWLRARPGVTSILIGSGTDAQLADNLAAAFWSLTANEIAALDRAS